ncbi:MAG: hypothetical protein ACRDLF_16065 [Solirubrobacteraceae bacterium]
MGTLGETVYHVELRHFPRNVCRFNLSGEQLRTTVLEPWAADRPFELGELKWDPRHARLTVLEGPPIPPAQLSMGRGWRTAQRQGKDVTAQLLAAAGEALARAGGVPVASAAQGAPGGAPAAAATSTPVGEGATDLAADSLGLELLAQMGPEQTALHRAWELAATRDPSGPASDALALAERAVASLLRARLIVLLRAAGPGATPEAMREQDAAAALQAPESWTGTQIWMRRA